MKYTDYDADDERLNKLNKLDKLNKNRIKKYRKVKQNINLKQNITNLEYRMLSVLKIH